ncbi:hypothetical protein Salat_1437400 [Sesamum alatum]|uniref:Zinc finger GRF-type domain-containing protein n=1 Tax=Sesamum alatum TaxID=300844 RepID=A0AAE1YB02_9LAMI|nr:hypothetical protein Salat_1437400 [Sesamum alatum]
MATEGRRRHVPSYRTSSSNSATFSPPHVGSPSGSNIVYCDCGLEVVMGTSWTTSNPGKRFRSCPGRSVRYLLWYVLVGRPPMCQRSTEVIPGLLKRLARNDEVVLRLENRMDMVEKDIRRAKRMIWLVVFTTALCVTATSAYFWSR